MAAGLLMVREAGGVVTDLAGGSNLFQTGGVLASNDQLHRLFLGLVGDKAIAKPYPQSVASAAT
jgi:myo-inositol-1(or 4)-monophosphatase